MIHARHQHTIASECKLSGIGYWSAKRVSVVMHPAPVNTGIVLVRSDLPSQPTCLAHVSNRTDARLRTNLNDGAASFEMIEHLMAALYALEIDNCLVEIDSWELPGLDGSSQPYVDVLSKAGLIIQAQLKQRLVIDQVITLREGDTWITASPSANGESHFGYQLAFDKAGPICNQSHGINCTPGRFTRELCDARTFVTEQQAQQLHASGVATHVGYHELLVFGDDGPIDNELRYRNECARHKTLDLIGDLALVGVELVGKFVSHRGGHHLNGKMAKALWDLAAQTRSTPVLLRKRA